MEEVRKPDSERDRSHCAHPLQQPDSILIGYALDAFVIIPSFSYGAGLNLYNTGYTAYFMNRLGARVDRRKRRTPLPGNPESHDLTSLYSEA